MAVILREATASRFIALALALGSDWLLPDHEPTGVLEPSFSEDCTHASSLRAFTRWDAAHMLAVSSDGGWEEQEYSHAFFPGYPLLVRWLGMLLGRLELLPFCATELRIVAGLLLSNGAFLNRTRAIVLERDTPESPSNVAHQAATWSRLESMGFRETVCVASPFPRPTDALGRGCFWTVLQRTSSTRPTVHVRRDVPHEDWHAFARRAESETVNAVIQI